MIPVTEMGIGPWSEHPQQKNAVSTRRIRVFHARGHGKLIEMDGTKCG